MAAIRIVNKNNAVYISGKAQPSGGLTAAANGDLITIVRNDNNERIVRDVYYRSIHKEDGTQWGLTAAATVTALNNYIQSDNPDGVIKSTDKITSLTGITEGDFQAKPGYTVFVGSTDGSLQTSDALLLSGSDVRVNGALVSGAGTNIALTPGSNGKVRIHDAYNLPTSDGTSGQVLTTDGSGALSFANQTGGVTSVNSQTGAVVLSIDNLSDVDTSTVAPTDGQVLVWDNTASKWEPGTVSGGGSSPWTTSGSDIYYDTGNVGVGTTTPSQPLHVDGNAKVDGQLIIQDGTFDHIVIGNGPIPASTAGSGGVVIGQGAGRFGHRNNNVLIGEFAGFQGLSSSDRNVAIGTDALKSGGAKNNNVAIGYEALQGSPSPSSSFDNTVAVGYQALTALTTGAGNTAVGYQAGDSITESSYNTVVGYQAGQSQFDHSTSVTALGYQAGYTTTLGGIFIGKQAGYNVNNSSNILIGDSAGQNITSGSSNVGVGNGALRGTGSGAGSVALGGDAGRYTTDGGNTLLGHQSGRGAAGSNFSDTVAVGYQALTALTTGAGNTAVGYQASDAMTVSAYTTALGYQALSAVNDTTTNADGSTAVGYLALSSLTNATGNTAVGYRAGVSVNGPYNTIVGHNVGQNLTGGNKTIIIGSGNAGNGLVGGTHNTVIGYNTKSGGSNSVEGLTAVGSGAANQGSTQCTHIGYQAGLNNGGTYSTTLGASAGRQGTKSSIVAIGAGANNGVGGSFSVAIGRGSTAGTNTVAVGYEAGSNLTDSVFIGYQAGNQETNSNRLYIENSSSATPLIYGEFDNDILRVNGTLQVNDPASTGYAFPAATGTLGQVLEVDANGDLVFATPSGGSGGGLGGADQTLTADRIITLDGSSLTIEDSSAQNHDTLIINSDGGVVVGPGGGQGAGFIQIREASSNGSNYVQLIAPASLTSSPSFTLPSADGTNGQVLTTNGSGTLSFTTASGSGGGLGGADQTLTADRTIDTNGYNLDIELDPTGTADTFTIHDGTHDLFQVDTGTTGVLFSVNDVSGLPKLEVDEDEGVIAKSIKVDDSALTAAGQYGKGAEIWYQGTSTPTAGSVYYLDSSGNWANTDASAVATAKGMLSVSAGTDSDVDGMVIKGFVYVGTDPGGSVGDVVYLSETANQLTTTAPTTASAVVRVCGYKVGTNIVYFDPSKDWIELA